MIDKYENKQSNHPGKVANGNRPVARHQTTRDRKSFENRQEQQGAGGIPPGHREIDYV
jgi:hypothetical protein